MDGDWYIFHENLIAVMIPTFLGTCVALDHANIRLSRKSSINNEISSGKVSLLRKPRDGNAGVVNED